MSMKGLLLTWSTGELWSRSAASCWLLDSGVAAWLRIVGRLG